VVFQLIREGSFRFVYFIASQKLIGRANSKYFFDSSEESEEVFPSLISLFEAK